MVDNIKPFDKRRHIKKLLFIIIGLIIINIIMYPIIIKLKLTYLQNLKYALICFLLSFNILGFIFGLFVALFPFKKLKYSEKYLRSSLLSIIGLNSCVTICLFILLIMSFLGLYKLPNSNNVKQSNSDTIIVKNNDGNMGAKGRLIKGKREGNWKEWDDKGNLSTDMNYQKGLAQGHAIMYYPDGHKKAEGEYVNQIPNGKWTILYPNGQIQAVGEFNMGTKSCCWKYFNDKGEEVKENTNP